MKPFIRQLVLKGFRSIPAARIEFDNPTILVGRNASGKSNIVSAFSFLADAMRMPLPTVFDRAGGFAAVRNRSSGGGRPPSLAERNPCGRSCPGLRRYSRALRRGRRLPDGAGSGSRTVGACRGRRDTVFHRHGESGVRGVVSGKHRVSAGPCGGPGRCGVVPGSGKSAGRQGPVETADACRTLFSHGGSGCSDRPIRSRIRLAQLPQLPQARLLRRRAVPRCPGTARGVAARGLEPAVIRHLNGPAGI